MRCINLKIIITVNTYYPLKDGVQFVTQYHAENLAKRGHNVVVFTTNHGNDVEEIHNGVKIIRFNVVNKHTIYMGEKDKYLQRLKAELKNADAIINVCTQHPLTDWCFSIFDSIKCKKILYMHGMYDKSFNIKTISNVSDLGHKIWNNIRWGIYYKNYKKIFKKYDKVIQLHKFDTGYIFFKKKYNIESNIIENAVDDKFFTSCKERKKYAISVANYMPRKNQEFILRAFYKSKIEKDYELILIGSEKNAYYHKLISLKEELENKFGHKNVKLLFNIDRKETINMIKKASIYLLGSKWEAFPISIIEAMAGGIPFISTDVGIVKYLPGGVIVNKEDEMAYWLEVLATDDRLREYIGTTGNQYAINHMTIEKKVDDLERIIKGE